MTLAPSQPRVSPDADFVAHERRLVLPGFLPAVCVVCSAALQVPEGTTVVRCPGCEEDAEHAAWDEANAQDPYDGGRLS